MHLSLKDHPFLASIVALCILAIYAAGYATDGHSQVASVLRAPPHSYTTLIIYRYRWTESRTDLGYIGISARGWDALHAQVDAGTGDVTLK